MDPRNSILTGFWIVLVSLFFWDLVIKLVIQKKEVLLLPAQIIIIIYKIFGKSKEINRIKETNKIAPNSKKDVVFFFISGIIMSFWGLVLIIDGIVVVFQLK